MLFRRATDAPPGRRLAQPWSEEFSRNLEQRIATNLHLGTLIYWRDPIELPGRAGERGVGRWVLWMRSLVDPVPGVHLVRAGYLFYIDEAAYVTLGQSLKDDLGDNAIVVPDLPRRMINYPELGQHTIGAILTLQDTDWSSTSLVIEPGAGDGMLSAAIAKVCPAPIILIEQDVSRLDQAVAVLSLSVNGGLRQQQDIFGLKADLRHPEQITGLISGVIDRYGLNARAIAVVSQIGGPWKEYEITNGEPINIIRRLDQQSTPARPLHVTLMLGAGYRGSVKHLHQLTLERDELERLGFAVEFPSSPRHPFGLEPILNWRATRPLSVPDFLPLRQLFKSTLLHTFGKRNIHNVFDVGLGRGNWMRTIREELWLAEDAHVRGLELPHPVPYSNPDVSHKGELPVVAAEHWRDLTVIQERSDPRYPRPGTVDLLHAAFTDFVPTAAASDLAAEYKKLMKNGPSKEAKSFLEQNDRLVQDNGWFIFAHSDDFVNRKWFMKWLGEKGYPYRVYSALQAPRDYPKSAWWNWIPHNDELGLNEENYLRNYIIVAKKTSRVSIGARRVKRGA